MSSISLSFTYLLLGFYFVVVGSRADVIYKFLVAYLPHYVEIMHSDLLKIVA